MNENNDVNLINLSQFLAEHFGLDFPYEKQNDLKRAIDAIAKSYHFKNANACINWIMYDELPQTEMEKIISYFTVGETYFFRETHSFELLEYKILPQLIESRRNHGKNLRFWSAGCSSGEEAYSLAILLNELLPDIKNWNITIIASDINVNGLQKLKQGIYTEWSFRNSPEKIKQFFTKNAKNQYELSNSIKKMITPIYLNLISDSYPSLLNNTNAMDIILCRNVLMYFIPPMIQKVISSLRRSLAENGLLFVSSSEHLLVQDAYLKLIQGEGISYYQKQDHPIQKYEFQNLQVEIPCYNFHLQNTETEIKTESKLETETKDNVQLVSQNQENKHDHIIFNITPDKTIPELPLDNPISNLILDKDDFNLKQDNKEMLACIQEFANLGKLNEALNLANKNINKNTIDEKLYYLRGLIHTELGNIKDAKQDYRKAIYLKHDYVLPYFCLGNLARSQGNLAEAKRNYDIVMSLIEANNSNELIPDSDGLTMERLKEVIESISDIK